MQIRRVVLSWLLLAGVCVAQAVKTGGFPHPTRDTYLKLAAEVEDALHNDVLGVWFPRAVDNEHGGFHSHFARDWKTLPSDGKFSVFQGRMTWVASQVVLREPQLKDQFVPIARRGVEYLQNVMWDKQDGGFFWGLDDAGKITPQFGDNKELYGIGFCIYGAAAAYQATNDQQALELAKKGFAWVDQHAHDTQHGGYFEWLTRDGKPVPMRIVGGRVESNSIGPIGFKSMNTHIHLLEAYTQLYEVWPDATLRARLEELLAVVRDKILTRIVRECRYEAGLSVQGRPTAPEIELAWVFHSGIFYYGVRKYIYEAPVLDDKDRMIRDAIAAFLAGYQEVFARPGTSAPRVRVRAAE